MWEKESITDVQCLHENRNPRVHRSSGKLGKSRFPLEHGVPSGWDFHVPTEYQYDGFYFSRMPDKEIRGFRLG